MNISQKSPLTGALASATPLRQLIKSSGVYAISSIAVPMISLVLAPFLTHALSPEDYGILTILNALIGLGAGITQLGLGSAFFRAYGYDYTESADRRIVFGTVTILLGLVSLLTVALIALLARPLADLFLGRPSLSGLLVLTAGVVFLQNLTVPGFSWLRVENRALFYSLLSICNVLITLIANILLVGFLRLGPAGSLLATGCGYASALLGTLPLIFSHSTFKIRPDIARGLLAFGLPLVLSYVCSWILQLSDRYLLSIFASLAETAKYAVAYTLGSAMSVVVIAPFNLAWPAAIFAIGRREDAVQVFKLCFRWFSLLLLFAAYSLSLVGVLVLNWLFPAPYHAESYIIPLVALSIALYGVYFVVGIGVPLTRKTPLGVLYTALAALTNVALNLMLIPRFGAAGAAISTLIAYAALTVVAYGVGQRIYRVPFEIGLFLLALLIGAALYTGNAFLGQHLGTYGSWGASVGTLILYGFCLALLGRYPIRNFVWTRLYGGCLALFGRYLIRSHFSGRGDRSPSDDHAHRKPMRMPADQVGERSPCSAEDKVGQQHQIQEETLS